MKQEPWPPRYKYGDYVGKVEPFSHEHGGDFEDLFLGAGRFIFILRTWR
jgi:hypothetical protein